MDRYTVCKYLLQYSAVSVDTLHVVVLNHGDIRLRIMYEYHDAPVGGHHGRRENISHGEPQLLLAPFVRKYVQAYEVCQQ